MLSEQMSNRLAAVITVLTSAVNAVCFLFFLPKLLPVTEKINLPTGITLAVFMSATVLVAWKMSKEEQVQKRTMWFVIAAILFLLNVAIIVYGLLVK